MIKLILISDDGVATGCTCIGDGHVGVTHYDANGTLASQPSHLQSQNSLIPSRGWYTNSLLRKKG
jgi:hypothetical protein